MIHSLKKKFVIINMLLVSIVLIITFAAVYASTYQKILRETNNAMERMLDDRNDLFPKKEIGGMDQKPPQNNPPPFMMATFAVQLNAQNKIVQTFENNVSLSNTAAVEEMIALCLKEGENQGILRQENFRYLVAINAQGTKIVFTDRSNEISQLTALIKTSVLVGAGSLLAFLAISLFLARWAVKPIAKSLEQQRQFVADASHELKTPLTVILANTNIVLTDKEKSIFQQYKWIEYIKTEAERMSVLVNNLLFLAKSDDGRSHLVFSTVNMSDVVWSVLLPFESVVFEQRKTLNSNIESDVFLQGDEGKLKQLVAILIDNAIKYSGEKGAVNVTLTKHPDKLRLIVHNSGEALESEQLAHLFERFYRVDQSRAREKDGYGLGLAIAQSIVHTHNGKIHVTSTKESGTTFTVTLGIKNGTPFPRFH